MMKRKIEYWENTGNIIEPLAIAVVGVAICTFVAELLRIIL